MVNGDYCITRHLILFSIYNVSQFVLILVFYLKDTAGVRCKIECNSEIARLTSFYGNAFINGNYGFGEGLLLITNCEFDRGTELQPAKALLKQTTKKHKQTKKDLCTFNIVFPNSVPVLLVFN